MAWLKKYIDVSLPAEKLADKLTLSGTKVEEVTQGDSAGAIINIEVTSNRPDCLSILGLAQEVSAITGKNVKSPHAYRVRGKSTSARKAPIDILVEDKKGCPRYTARILRDVHVSESPSEIQRLLISAGTRPISNVVDSTNFVLFECGQPMHAFDLDKIEGGRIIIRRSRKGEKLLGIDGIEYSLDDKTLIIADVKGPIAIAGVVGGKLTEVTSVTKNLLLESAYFDPITIRQAVKKYKITTESSYRFERGVNPENVSKASVRGAELICEWAGGQDVAGLLDKNSMVRKPLKKISLRLSRMEMILGLKIPASRVVKILKSLALSTSTSGTGKILVQPSPARRDLGQEIDLMEEILRIEGFDKAPLRLPPTHYTYEPVRDSTASGVMKLKRFLASLGFDEIITHSLLSAKKIQDSDIELSEAHLLTNAVSVEQSYFRPSLLPGMLEAMAFNIHRKATALKFFEIGHCILRGKEETVMSLGFYGAMDENWVKKHNTNFYDVKGILENCFDFLKIKNYTWLPGTGLNTFSCGSDLLVEKDKIGSVGEVSESVLKRWDIPHAVYYAELTVDHLFENHSEFFKVRPVFKYPAVRRDIAFIIDNRVSVKDLENAMRNAASPFLSSAVLFDQFVGKNVPQDKRSLAFSLSYQKEDGTFNDQEIQALQQRVGEALKRLYQVEFR